MFCRFSFTLATHERKKMGSEKKKSLKRKEKQKSKTKHLQTNRNDRKHVSVVKLFLSGELSARRKTRDQQRKNIERSSILYLIFCLYDSKYTSQLSSSGQVHS